MIWFLLFDADISNIEFEAVLDIGHWIDIAFDDKLFYENIYIYHDNMDCDLIFMNLEVNNTNVIDILTKIINTNKKLYHKMKVVIMSDSNDLDYTLVY